MILDYVAYIVGTVILVIVLSKYSIKMRVISNDAIREAMLVSILNILSGLVQFISYVTFVVSSSAFTKLGKEFKTNKLASKDPFGRSRSQVLAVGLLPGIVGTAMMTLEILGFKSIGKFFIIPIAMIATSNADTWASEIGVLYRGYPRLILKPWRKAEPGTSGAISPLGVLSSIGGAFTIALITYVMLRLPVRGLIPYSINNDLTILTIITVSGFIGELSDSILGYLLQEKRLCKVCGLVCEKYVHCNSETIYLWGSRRIRGEHVNVISQIISALSCLCLMYLLL